MSLGRRGKTTNWSREITASQAQAEREAMLGEIPGKIVDFDAATQTATIQPLYRPLVNGEHIDMPELQEVPVRFPRIGGFVITSRVKPDDLVTLRPQMRSSEKYHDENKHEAPADTRSMALSDMEAFLDGGESLQNPIDDVSTDELELRTEDRSVVLQIGDGRVRAQMGEMRFLVSGDQFAQLKGPGGMHITVDGGRGVISTDRPIIQEADPNPGDGA